MKESTRRFLEDAALAKTAIDTEKLKEQLTDVQKSLKKAQRQREEDAFQANEEAKRAEWQAQQEQRRLELEVAEKAEQAEQKRLAVKGMHFLALANECFEKKNWSEALRNYEVAKKSSPEPFYWPENGVYLQKLAIYKMALCFSKMGDSEKSLSLLEGLQQQKDRIAIDADYLMVFMQGFNRSLYEVSQLRLKILDELPDKKPEVESEKRHLEVQMYRLFPDECPDFESAFLEESRREDIHQQVKAKYTEIKNLRTKLNLLKEHKKSDSNAKNWGELINALDAQIQQLLQTATLIDDCDLNSLIDTSIVESSRHDFIIPYKRDLLSLRCLALVAKADGPLTVPERTFLDCWGQRHHWSSTETQLLADDTEEVQTDSFNGDDKDKCKIIEDLYRCAISDGVATESEMAVIRQLAEAFAISNETVATTVEKVLALPSMTFVLLEKAMQIFEGDLPSNIYRGNCLPVYVMARLNQIVEIPADETIIAVYEKECVTKDESFVACLFTDKHIYDCGRTQSGSKTVTTVIRRIPCEDVLLSSTGPNIRYAEGSKIKSADSFGFASATVSDERSPNLDRFRELLNMALSVGRVTIPSHSDCSLPSSGATKLAMRAFDGVLPKHVYRGDSIPTDVLARLRKIVTIPDDETLVAAYESKQVLKSESLSACIFTDKHLYDYAVNMLGVAQPVRRIDCKEFANPPKRTITNSQICCSDGSVIKCDGMKHEFLELVFKSINIDRKPQ